MASIIKRRFKVKHPDGRVEVRQAKTWTIQYRDAAGKIKRVSKVDGKRIRDKAVARQVAAELERDMAKGAVGMVDPYRKHKLRPLSEHVTDYTDALRLAGRSAKYVQNQANRLAVLLRECKWNSTSDITTESLRRFQQRRARSKWVGQQGDTASAETLNQYAETARAFVNWMATEKRMEGIPTSRGRMIATALAGLAVVEGDTKRKRRALTDEQVSKLLSVAPEERRLVYRFAIATGLRRQELEQLQWGDLGLLALKPYIQLRAWSTKARRGDRLPMTATLAEDLRKVKPAGATEGDRVFPEVPSLETWKADLVAAGIPYRDGQGRQVDFHAGTRKTLCTRLHRAGKSLVIAQRLMRHVDPRLTAVDYTDDDGLGIEDAVLDEIAPAKPAAATTEAVATA